MRASCREVTTMNMPLGYKRAERVVQYLAGRGVARARLVPRDGGERGEDHIELVVVD